MRSSRCVRTAGAAVALVCALALTGCGSAVGKTGAAATTTTVIPLGAADVNNPRLLSFVKTVDTRSHHRLRVRIDQKTYYSETPGAEQKLPAALGAGRVDLAFSPSRDWAQADAAGFSALQSPGLVTTTAEEIRLAHDPLAAELLRGLGARHVVGLGLVPDEPRRLITRSPVLDVSDLAGRRIRISDNPGTAAMVGTLGATAVQGIDSGQAKDALLRKDLDGVETGPTSASHYNDQGPAPYISSFALLPKFEVLAANQAFWNRLAPADRRVLQSAATATVRSADRTVPAQEEASLRLLCRNGAVIVRPQDDGLRRIVAAAGTAGPTGTAATTMIARIGIASGATDWTGAVTSHPDAGPVPSNCRVATSAAAAAKDRGMAAKPVDSGTASNPEELVGVYRIDVSKQDLDRGGMTGPDWATAVTYRWRLSADGTMLETQTPDYPDQGPQHGTWRADGDQLTFVFGGAGSSGEDFHETVRWSYFKGTLTMKPVDVQDMSSLVIYGVPWHRIG